MAFVAIISNYPLSKQAEVTQVFNKLLQTPPPPFIKGRGQFQWPSRDGAEVFTVFEIDNAKLYDGFLELAARMAEFSSIEGYRYDLRVVATAADMQAMARLIAERQAKQK
ncbi:MAG: hypothetical protein MUO99_04100 [Dehalococcoidales bacterium]|jgi:hypothetical protein|nr:hypothetical protein [Dehalococcoidales bacterium]